ncbi:UNKNOWN [Stylonychia lemnae]|uniref:Uncharacterized protein n=1 Tax=Stylonychia lemnae TaxID=5949 RepID=A0A078AZ69_STYLE|nr:UNKNOWN [Stylonychia lemnae]|eukprot:CDW87396.1 UNKNOWN [Stylonychia lemnae]
MFRLINLQLKFGDGITGDFSIEYIDLTLDQKIITFAGYGYSNSSFTNIPIIGAYAKYDQISKVTWLKTLKSSQQVSRVSAIALSYTQEYLLVTVSNMFGLLLLNVQNGQMIYSGIGQTQTYDEIPNYGALMDKNDDIFVIYQTQTQNNVIIQKFSFDLKQTIWKQVLIESGKPSAISLIKIDTTTAESTIWNLEFTKSDFYNAKTYDLRVEGKYAAGCFYSEKLAGYIAFNEDSNDFNVKYLTNSGFLCLGIHLLPNSSIAFFYRLQSTGVDIRYWMTYDPFGDSNLQFQLYSFNYASQYGINSKFQYFKSVDWMHFYFIGNDGGQKTKGFIESNFPSQSCREPPKLRDQSSRNKIDAGLMIKILQKIGVSNGFTNQNISIQTVDTTKTILTSNENCEQPVLVTIQNPIVYNPSFICQVNQPCNIEIGQYYLPQNCTDAPQLVYTLLDSQNQSFPLIYQQLMVDDFVNITFNPSYQQIGIRKYQITAQMLLNGQVYIENTDVNFNVTVQDICQSSFNFLNIPNLQDYYYLVGSSPILIDFKSISWEPAHCSDEIIFTSNLPEFITLNS